MMMQRSWPILISLLNNPQQVCSRSKQGLLVAKHAARSSKSASPSPSWLEKKALRKTSPLIVSFIEIISRDMHINPLIGNHAFQSVLFHFFLHSRLAIGNG